MSDLDKELTVNISDLPLTFTIKYLGFSPAKGLYGLKHTRKPVDFLVNKAKNLPPNEILPIVKFEVNLDGVRFTYVDESVDSKPVHFPIEMISYGVQDFVYTRVFSMIIVVDDNLRNGIPFLCHCFLTDSKQQTRKITYALAAAFQEYGRKMKTLEKEGKDVRRRIAIDLRTPEEMAAAEEDETEA